MIERFLDYNAKYIHAQYLTIILYYMHYMQRLRFSEFLADIVRFIN